MKLKTITRHRFFLPAFGALLVVSCGLLLWAIPFGEPWVNASYDYLFRFGSRPVTNRPVVIYMDSEAYDFFHQTRGEPWSRALHAQLLEKLAADGCRMTVFDVHFGVLRDKDEDAALAAALKKQNQVVLMAKQMREENRNVLGAEPRPPANLFLEAPATNWGVAHLDPDLKDKIVRKHWPFPSPGPYPSLAWTASRLVGAALMDEPRERWLRYYGVSGPWTSLGYKAAFTTAPDFFRDAIVFIGNRPEGTAPDDQQDKFQIPYTRWTGEAVGGVDVLATMFLNLVNGDWLRRPPAWLEVVCLLLSGVALGAGLCLPRWWVASVIGLLVALASTLGTAACSYATNYWFPWLIVAGGQVPCAVAYAGLVSFFARRLPDAPDYEMIQPPFGEGAYGKVWVARNAVGQWQALKAVYRSKFGVSSDPYEREFRGITNYKPVSDKHPGLLRVDFVSTKKSEGYFYYVMELGDSLTPGWQENPATYKPRDLASVRAQAEQHRLPVRECVRIVVALAEALEFLHQQGLTHRDIKPSNVIFVNGRPKLADVGLVVEAGSRAAAEASRMGTPGYMPPEPEPLGTPQADIYGLGMVLYVISTGGTPPPGTFPVLSESLVEKSSQDFIGLNAIFLKACQPDRAKRYTSAAQMRGALLELERLLETETKPVS
ncbi:MAG TPA: serine/threonine-protein kinase [Verrucomicrobiae bacterium]|nr:serine/threonine-protein kinase [Verrucomicrobiae bacterium]